MNCKVTTENIIEAVNKLAVGGNKPKAVELMSLLQKTTGMDNHFETDMNSGSKLAEYVGNTEKTKAVELLSSMLDKTAENLVIQTAYDTSLNGFKSENDSNYQGWQSVIVYLMENGKLNEAAKQAMALVGAEWLANDATETLAVHRDDSATKALLGVDKNSTLTQEQRESVKDIDGLVNKTANQLGAKVYKLLGIKAKKDIELVNNSRIADTLKTELGLMVLKALEKNGTIELVKDKEVSVKRNGKAVTEKWNTYKVLHVDNGRIWIDDGAQAVDTVQEKVELSKQLESAEGEGSVRGIYLTKEQAVPKDSEIVNEGPTGKVSEVSAKHKEAVKKQSGTANWLNKGYVKTLQKLDADGKYLRKLLGYTDPAKVLKIREVAVKGKNQMIDKAIEDLNYVVDAVGYGTKMYGRWKVITNNRFMLDSNTFNWQDKKLHRYAVDRGASTVSTDMKDTNSKLFMLALAQAFDMKVDKQRLSTTLKEINDLVTELHNEVEFSDTSKSLEEYHDSEEYTDNVRGVIDALAAKGHDGEIEHMLRGATELVNLMYMQEKGESTYDTGMMIETDAITSGYAIKGIQFPLYADANGKPYTIEQIVEEIQKVGVFEGEGNYGDRVEGGAEDAYETPAGVLSKKLNGAPEAIVKLLDPKMEVVKGKVKVSRAFMKQPFMTLNYGSGVKGIIDDAVSSAEENFYGLVQDYVITRKVYLDGGLSKEERSKLLAKGQKLAKELSNTATSVFGKNSSIVDRAKSNGLGFKLTKKEQARLQDVLYKVIKKPLEDTLKDEYKHFIDLSGTLNKSFQLRFQLAKNMIDSKIEEEFSKRVDKAGGNKNLVPPLNRKDMEKILEEVHDVLPVFKTPLDKKDGDKAEGLIAKLERVSFESKGAVGNVATTGKVDVKGAKSKLKNAALEVYELVESATGGAVLPIHFFDGSIQAEVLSKYNALGVHDANYGLLDDIADITKYYNEKFYELNKSYSLAKEVLDGMLTSIEKADEKALNSVKKKELIGNLEEVARVYEAAKANREKLFSKELTIQHAYFEGPEWFAEFSSKDSKVELNDEIADLESRLEKANNRLTGKQEAPKQESTSAETMQEDVSIAIKEIAEENEQKKDEVC